MGGWTDRKEFDAANPPPKRKGHDIAIENEEVDPADLMIPAKLPRPDQSKLKKITKESLRPPPRRSSLRQCPGSTLPSPMTR